MAYAACGGRPPRSAARRHRRLRIGRFSRSCRRGDWLLVSSKRRLWRAGKIAGVLSVVVAALGIAAFGGGVALAYRRGWQWTGLPAARAANADAEDRPAKTLWDWLQLLGIPLVLATIALLVTDAQTHSDQRREDQRAARQSARAADSERENTLQTRTSRKCQTSCQPPPCAIRNGSERTQCRANGHADCGSSPRWHASRLGH